MITKEMNNFKEQIRKLNINYLFEIKEFIEQIIKFELLGRGILK